MQATFAYLSQSALRSEAGGQTLSLSPNLARDPFLSATPKPPATYERV